MRINTTVRIFGKMLLFHFQSMNIPKEETKGMSSRVPFSCEHLVFLDYDNIKDERLKEELMALQEVFEVGDFEVFASNEFGRHAICVDRMLLRDALAVVYASNCDEVFKRGIRINEFRCWVLRTHPKGDRERPKYLYTVESPYNGQRLQSQAHAKFLEEHYGFKVRLANPDGNTILERQRYKTASKVSAAELTRELKK